MKYETQVYIATPGNVGLRLQTSTVHYQNINYNYNKKILVVAHFESKTYILTSKHIWINMEYINRTSSTQSI